MNADVPPIPAEPKPSPKRNWRRRGLWLLALIGLTFVPMPEPTVEAFGGSPFVWNSDERWHGLEEVYQQQHAEGCARFSGQQALVSVRALVDGLESAEPGDRRLVRLEQRFFDVAARFAACPQHVSLLLETFADLRRSLKMASRRWRAEGQDTRHPLYRLLYGGRLAIEEVLLQMDPDDVPAILEGTDEPSDSPCTELHGHRICSGDLLVSRGGAPTSALIARGNDYPGNFSHVALVHISEDGEFSTIESHIELGVVNAGLARFEEDTRLRLMVLRPRHDLREGDFAHQAATYARDRVLDGHIPYDFESDLEDHSRMFCSEVAADAYAHEEIYLWRGLTTMSGVGVARWLSLFGVRHFATFGPSDLEYDPQLVVVAEWRDPEVLRNDHVDAAVMDVMLEAADAGEGLPITWWKLPLARAAKLYSWLKNLAGEVGPVPEGMSAQAALRAETLQSRHRALRARLETELDAYAAQEGHPAPYWTMITFARALQEDAGEAD